ncbi:MAG TPA: PP2C family serine/threonine-protein phosphatase [Iamia sp.]
MQPDGAVVAELQAGDSVVMGRDEFGAGDDRTISRAAFEIVHDGSEVHLRALRVPIFVGDQVLDPGAELVITTTDPRVLRASRGDDAPSLHVSFWMSDDDGDAALHFESAGQSLTGSRPTNQDRIWYGSSLLLLADGVGGSAHGAEAAETAIETMRLGWDPRRDDLLVAVAQDANRRVLGRYGDTRLASTTLTAIGLSDQAGGRIVTANAGDSPAWLFQEGRLDVLTTSHRLSDELGRGEPLDRAKRQAIPNLVTRLVGSESVQFSTSTRSVRPGDIVVVASDGLSEFVSEATMRDALAVGADGPVEHLAARLIDLALETSDDNISVIVARVEHGEAAR